IDVFGPEHSPRVSDESVSDQTPTGGIAGATVDPRNMGDINECRIEYVEQEAFNPADTNAIQKLSFSGASAGTFMLGFSGQPTSATGSGDPTSGSTMVPTLTTSAGTFSVGEAITGLGIPANTTIAAIGSGTLELSQPAEQTTAGAELTAGTVLTYESEAKVLQATLQALGTIGSGRVFVTGPPGGPYKIEFAGPLTGLEVPDITVDSSGLTPPGASASIETTTPGGHWSGAAEIPCFDESDEEVDTHPIPGAGGPVEVHA